MIRNQLKVFHVQKLLPSRTLKNIECLWAVIKSTWWLALQELEYLLILKTVQKVSIYFKCLYCPFSILCAEFFNKNIQHETLIKVLHHFSDSFYIEEYNWTETCQHIFVGVFWHKVYAKFSVPCVEKLFWLFCIVFIYPVLKWLKKNVAGKQGTLMTLHIVSFLVRYDSNRNGD